MRPRRLLFLSFLLAGCSAAAAGGVQVDSRREGEAIEISAVGELAADPADAWTVLTDYEAYPRFIPDLAVSRVVERDGAAGVPAPAHETQAGLSAAVGG